MPGHGIGPEISKAVKDIFAAARGIISILVEIEWEEHEVYKTP